MVMEDGKIKFKVVADFFCGRGKCGDEIGAQGLGIGKVPRIMGLPREGDT